MTEQVRHRPPTVLSRPRGLVVVCSPLRTTANASTIMRTATCCGVERLVLTGDTHLDKTIARTAETDVVERRRSLVPVLKKLREEGYTLVGLEQTNDSVDLHTYAFPYKTALVIGNERLGISDEALEVVDVCVEIPVWGEPASYNVATATSMAMYEYCKQHA